MSELNQSLSLSDPHPTGLKWTQKMGLVLVGFALLLTLIGLFGNQIKGWQYVIGSSILYLTGGLLYFFGAYSGQPQGIKNNGVFFKSITDRGAIGWLLGIVLTGFYVILYFFPGNLEGLIRLTDPLSMALSGNPASEWFLYGFFYTMAIVIMGIKMIWKYKHNKYQIIRTLSVMFFQFGFAFLIPNLIWGIKLSNGVNAPYYDWTAIWPLRYYELQPDTVNHLASPEFGSLGTSMIIWGIASILIITPVLTYYFGKRWYCSWVCGCGGLAETAGDPFRQLSDKSLKAWKVERWLIHSVLIFIVLSTGLLWANWKWGGSLLGSFSGNFAAVYSFGVGAIFSGVIGVGFYPIMGSRVWCRFGCPMAAILGIIQRFKSRFRITTNGGQCISCGNCSTYCEMGIDVRWYAQRGQNIVRASCVGCGICAAVCPRGVLRLENGPEEGRLNENPILIGNRAIQLDPAVQAA